MNTENNTIEIMGMDSNVIVRNTSWEDLSESTANLVFIAIDSSGSMDKYTSTMRDALQNFKNALVNSKEKDSLLVSRADFNDKITLINGYQPIDEFNTVYNASGTTVLYDIIVKQGENLLKYRQYLKDNGTTVKAVFAIFSDGDDNGSKKSAHDAKVMVENLNNEEVITAFISFEQDGQNNATATAKALGFKNILNSQGSETELRNAFSCLSRSVIDSSKSVIVKQDNFFSFDM